MSDAARWEVRGPVQSVQTQFAEWDPETADWRPLKTRTVAIFRQDGQLRETRHHNADGSVSREVHLYDDRGRLTEDEWWANDALSRRVVHTYDTHDRPLSSNVIDPLGAEHELEVWRYGSGDRTERIQFPAVLAGSLATSSGQARAIQYAVQGSDFAVSASDAATITTVYDDRGRPSEVVLRNADRDVLSRVVFSRDHDGLTRSERVEFGSTGGPLGTAFEPNIRQLLATVFKDQTFWQAQYAYDEKGRRIETIRRMGGLSEERVTVRYDDFDNPVEEIRSEITRNVSLDDGLLHSDEERRHIQQVRFEYRYDSHANWTERIVLERVAPDADERPANIERRTIEYYD